MREELHLMELVDRYLDGKLDAAERAAFEARLELNDGLRELTEDQRVLREGMVRLKLRTAVGKAHTSYHFGKWWPGIGGAVIIGGVITAGAMFMRTEAYHEWYDRFIHDPYIIQQDTVPSENEFVVPAPPGSDSLTIEQPMRYDTVTHVIKKYYWVDPASGDTVEVKNSSPAESARGEAAQTPVDAEEGLTLMYTNKEEPQAVFAASPEIDPKPVFPGGDGALRRFLMNNLTYPPKAEELNVQGRVLTSFVVMKDGSIRYGHIEQGIGEGCDEEALRVIGLMPKWRPGRLNGELVNVRVEMPIVFMLSSQQLD